MNLYRYEQDTIIKICHSYHVTIFSGCRSKLAAYAERSRERTLRIQRRQQLLLILQLKEQCKDMKSKHLNITQFTR